MKSDCGLPAVSSKGLPVRLCRLLQGPLPIGRPQFPPACSILRFVVFFCDTSILPDLVDLVQDNLDLVDPKFFDLVNELAIDKSLEECLEYILLRDKVELEFSEIIVMCSVGNRLCDKHADIDNLHENGDREFCNIHG